jgi:lipopolysaccharide/colanic/teichoic acid biosynthesis glycosyltransferase
MLSQVRLESEPTAHGPIEIPALAEVLIERPRGVFETPLSGEASWAARTRKRALDVTVASIALLVLAPLMITLTFVVSIASRGRPFFGQVRLGRDGRTFRCWKFRTMRRDAEDVLLADPELYAAYVANDFRLECDEDPRVTPIGRFLRKSSLDELPQLFNVLLGSMSIVGPRPVVGEELERCYNGFSDEYLAVRPGITGPWQVSGRYDIRYPERAAIDAEYVNTWTLRRDVAIILRTPTAMIGRPGAP